MTTEQKALVKITIKLTVEEDNWQEFQERWRDEYVQSLIEHAAIASVEAVLPARKRRHTVELARY